MPLSTATTNDRHLPRRNSLPFMTLPATPHHLDTASLKRTLFRTHTADSPMESVSKRRRLDPRPSPDPPSSSVDKASVVVAVTSVETSSVHASAPAHTPNPTTATNFCVIEGVLRTLPTSEPWAKLVVHRGKLYVQTERGLGFSAKKPGSATKTPLLMEVIGGHPDDDGDSSDTEMAGYEDNLVCPDCQLANAFLASCSLGPRPMPGVPYPLPWVPNALLSIPHNDQPIVTCAPWMSTGVCAPAPYLFAGGTQVGGGNGLGQVGKELRFS